MKKIGVLVSGGGTNLQAILRAIDYGIIKKGIIITVVSNRESVYALEIAKQNNISSSVILKKDYSNVADYNNAILNHMKKNNIDLIVMAGFLSIVGDPLVKEYKNKIINIHPSLIPSFCGEGYYGLKVHQEVIKRGVKITGATVHFVDNIVDGGPIIMQKAVKVKQNDTPGTLQKRVMKEAEWIILPKAISLFCEGKLKVINNKVIIEEI